MDDPNQPRGMQLPEGVQISPGEGELDAITIDTDHAWSQIYLHGGHVAAWQPTGHEAVLWMSRYSLFQASKPIRGGVPICFPWFGPSENGPSHGFARIMPWSLVSLESDAQGQILVTLQLTANEQTRTLWPYDFQALYTVTVGPTLTMRLQVRNTGNESFEFEEALHTYFQVGDIHHVSVRGLEGTTYIDKVGQPQRRTQPNQPITIERETDRVYINTHATCILEDTALGRRIFVEKQGSRSTVVWNPWISKSRAMADYGDEEWRGMICIETANNANNHLTLEPGQTHALTTTLRVEPIE